jgi:hypothetical protein
MLASIPNGAESPLGRPAGTHFARLVFVPHLEDRRRRPRRRAGSFLLLAAEFDGRVDDYIAALARDAGSELDPVLGHCAGYPGAAGDQFADWIRAHTIRANYSVIAYPGASLNEIQESIQVRGRLGRFAIRSRDLDAVDLQRAWQAEFGGGAG